MKHPLRCALLMLPVFTALVGPTGCGDGSDTVTVGDEEITLSIEPGSATKVVGKTQNYKAFATDSDGESDVTRLVQWSSSDTGIATIGAATGLAVARKAGTVVITAKFSKVVATAEFIVTREEVTEGSAGAAGATNEPTSGGAGGESSTSGGAGGESSTTGGAGGAPGGTTSGTHVYVSNLGGEGVDPSIRIFELTAEGNTEPVASVTGAATKLSGPSQMALAGDELFVANGEGKSILVFDVNEVFADATGNVAPIREIVGDNTTFTPFNPMGLILRGSSVVVSHQSTGLLVFPADGEGDLTPTSIGPSFFYAAHLSNSPVGNEILVAVPTPTSEVRGYLQNAGPGDAPLRVLRPGRAWARGVTTTLTGVFVATAGLTGASIEDSVTVFEYDAKTDDLPIRVIAGPVTGLHNPHGISVHGGELFVANQEENAVRVFDAIDDDATSVEDNVAPLRIIKGAATGLRFPAGMLVGTTGG